MKDSEKVGESVQPPISDLQPNFLYLPKESYYRSPFEIARDEEVRLQQQAAAEAENKAWQARRIADLLAWAKQKGLVPESATELPDGGKQAQLLTQLAPANQSQT